MINKKMPWQTKSKGDAGSWCCCEDAGCFCRGPGCSSPQPHGSSRLAILQLQGSSGLHGHQACSAQTFMPVKYSHIWYKIKKVKWNFISIKLLLKCKCACAPIVCVQICTHMYNTRLCVCHAVWTQVRGQLSHPALWAKEPLSSLNQSAVPACRH